MSSFSFSNLKAGVDIRGLSYLWDFQDVIFTETQKCVFLEVLAVAKLSENKKILLKCESAFLVNKFRNKKILSVSILQGSYSSAVKGGLLIYFF